MNIMNIMKIIKNICCILLFVMFMCMIYLNTNRCCYSCDFDDDYSLMGCPICPNGYPCIYPCYGKC